MTTHGVARDQLRVFVERIERLAEEKKTIEDDIKDVYGEAKSMGFDTKILKKLIAIRKKDEQARQEEELILDTYMAALGMIPQLDMFDKKTGEVFDREANRRRIMSEDMADHKSLVDEMADAGLISEEAREENKRLADAVATKFGNGPASALQSPRKAAEAVSERTASNPVANVEEEATGAIAAASVDPASRAFEESERQRASMVGFTGDCRTEGKEQMDASAASVGDAAANALGIPATILSATEEGDSNEVAHVHSHAATAGTRINHIVPATKPKTAREYRPNCLKPDACGSYVLDHCYSCKKAMKEQEEFA